MVQRLDLAKIANKRFLKEDKEEGSEK